MVDGREPHEGFAVLHENFGRGCISEFFMQSFEVLWSFFVHNTRHAVAASYWKTGGEAIAGHPQRPAASPHQVHDQDCECDCPRSGPCGDLPLFLVLLLLAKCCYLKNVFKVSTT